MKKIISLILSAALLLCSLCAYADDFDDYYAIASFSNELDYSCKSLISATLDAPLEILALFNDVLEQQYSPIKLDLSKIVGSMFEAKINMEMAVSRSESYDKIKAYIAMDTNLPVQLSDNLKYVTQAKLKLWIDFDVSDSSNKKLLVIIAHPFSDSYIKADLSEALDDQETVEALEAVKTMLSGDYLDKIKQVMKDNCTVKKSGTQYTVTITDEQFKNLLFDVIDIASSEEVALVEGETADELKASYEQAKQELAPLSKVQLLGESGITETLETDGTRAVKLTESVCFDLNIYDLAVAFGATEDDLFYGDAAITRENSRIAFTINAVTDVDSKKDTVKVELPVLTDENSYDIVKAMQDSEQAPDYDDDNYDGGHYDGEYSEEVYYAIITADGLPQRNDSYYDSPFVPLRNAMTAFEIGAEQITYSPDNGGVVTVMGNDKVFFDKLTITLSDLKLDCVIDGETHSYLNAVYFENGCTYISLEPLDEITGYGLYTEYITYDYDMKDYISMFALSTDYYIPSVG